MKRATTKNQNGFHNRYELVAKIFTKKEKQIGRKQLNLSYSMSKFIYIQLSSNRVSHQDISKIGLCSNKVNLGKITFGMARLSYAMLSYFKLSQVTIG